MFRRLHLVANNTRFVVLGERGCLANLGSWMMAAMLRRISADWQGQYGHPLLVVESFVDPQRFTGTLYQASNWTYVGNSKGYARSNGHYSDLHGHPKWLYVRALRRDAQRILSQRGELRLTLAPRRRALRAAEFAPTARPGTTTWREEAAHAHCAPHLGVPRTQRGAARHRRSQIGQSDCLCVRHRRRSPPHAVLIPALARGSFNSPKGWDRLDQVIGLRCWIPY